MSQQHDLEQAEYREEQQALARNRQSVQRARRFEDAVIAALRLSVELVGISKILPDANPAARNVLFYIPLFLGCEYMHHVRVVRPDDSGYAQYIISETFSRIAQRAYNERLVTHAESICDARLNTSEIVERNDVHAQLNFVVAFVPMLCLEFKTEAYDVKYYRP